MVSRGAGFDRIDGFDGFRDTEAGLNGDNDDLNGSREDGISGKLPSRPL